MIVWKGDKGMAPHYKKPDAETLYESEQATLTLLETFLKVIGYDFDTIAIDVDRALLNRAFVRVDKRLDYYRIYHNDTYLNEVREAAVVAYWILKYRPFRVCSYEEFGQDLNREAFSHLNENFALFLILSVIEGHRKHLNLPVFSADRFTIQQLRYGVRNWDLSKEALMLIAVSLSDTTTANVPQGESA